MKIGEDVLRARPRNIAAEEWQVRLELAALYRVFDWMGWTELIFNHITARVEKQRANTEPGRAALEGVLRRAGIRYEDLV